MFALLVVLRGYSNLFNLYNVAELSWNRIGRSGVQAETDNEKFAVMCSRSPQNLKFRHFTLLFCQGRRRNVPKFITHVQGIFLLIKSYCLMRSYDVPVAVAVVSAKLPITFNRGQRTTYGRGTGLG